VSRVSTYLNFQGNAAEAFAFYKEVFGTDYLGPVFRIGDMPQGPEGPPLSDAELDMIMHVELPILDGHVLMATDMLSSMGQEVRVGNNTTINLEVDSKDDADRLYAALSEGGSDATGLNDMPWGFYWGCCLDRFGIRWMFNTPSDGA
jgi:PhnB protein